MKAYRGSKGITPFLTLEHGGDEWKIHAPAALLQRMNLDFH
jgi:hypothetical protein